MINWVHLFLSSGQHIFSILIQQIIRRCALLISFVWKGKNHLSHLAAISRISADQTLLSGAACNDCAITTWHQFSPIAGQTEYLYVDFSSFSCVLKNDWTKRCKWTSSGKSWINFSFFVRWLSQLVTFLCYFRSPNRRVENPNSLFSPA